MQTKTILIRGGLVQDAVHREPRKVDLLLAGGKIAGIGTDLTAPEDAEIFDADGLDVYPGFVDAHTHIGLDGYGIGHEGCDYNEMNDIWTPPLTPRCSTRRACRYFPGLWTPTPTSAWTATASGTRAATTTR